MCGWGSGKKNVISKRLRSRRDREEGDQLSTKLSSTITNNSGSPPALPRSPDQVPQLRALLKLGGYGVVHARDALQDGLHSGARVAPVLRPLKGVVTRDLQDESWG